MTSETKIVQYLNEAHALEAALVQTLTAHIAMTPRGAYRDLLERHLDETRAQAERLLGRLSDLGESRNPIQLVYGIAQTAVGQVLAAGKFPLDLLRGSGGEEKLLKNAKDEAASEALEIATYDALEALATEAGDDRTAVLAREHRTQEEVFLKDLRAVIPQLARDVLAADVDGDASFRVQETGAADAARLAQSAAKAAAADVQETVADAADRVSRRAQDTARRSTTPSAPAPAPKAGGSGDLPIEGYDALPLAQILPKLRLLSQADLAKVDAHEREHGNRKRILDRVAKLRASTDGQPVGVSR